MDIKRLSDALRKIAYPPEMAFVETGILGQGFYPGCLGFSSRRSPIGGIMLLGRDFGVKSYYEGLTGLPLRDETALTWRHTRDIYLAHSPHPTLNDLPVWCTNYLMGIRLDGSAKGNVRERISSSDWVKFEDSCWCFLQKQIFLQRPLVIVVFGEDNRYDLLTDKRFGTKWSQTLQHTFTSDGDTHPAFVTFADHPHSLIRNTAKDAARLEVKRIRELYELHSK
ncbi:MAG: hypothetical protein WAN35_13060 [Terracidiphilus sp.]